MCGPSAQESELQESQAKFYNQLTAQDTQQYGTEQGILSQLTSTYAPILQAGPNQYGFSSAEDVTLNSEATEGVAQNYAAAKTALADTNAASGGGNSYLPSGVQEGEMASLDSSAAAQRSSEQLQIKQAGYDQGYKQFTAATSALEGAGSLANPTAYSNSATSAGSAEEDTNKAISAENTAWMAPLTAAVGGAAGAASGAWVNNLTKTCWVAAELYGSWGDPRVREVRHWIFQVWAKESAIGSTVADFYSEHGERIAGWIRQWPILRRVFLPLFDTALRKARARKP
jgi:hypothetical protein